ncbi:tyrosine-protein kinase SRK2-like [Acanthaster planci]|uniref:receptor protein-tyrosine kinase n=1 Tax=Acanthaster planci TaxID=133434 RepID=A0A8B7ZI73_ACAPL|nr:tyrosine-protein kinase SRK2-like [Acanthaster planci]XP_022105269.1 tyrosine-protein kinase SRK2-like [Acanthaster planci]
MGQYTVVLSWSPSSQVSDNISLYELRYNTTSTELPLKVFHDQDKLFYTKELEDVKSSSNYTAMVRAYTDDGKGGAWAVLDFDTHSAQFASNSTRSEELCAKLKPSPDVTTFASATTGQQTAPSYVAVIVVSFMATFAVVGALILRFIKRRKAVAESKEAIFVRYPEEGGSRKGTPAGMKSSFDELREPDVDFQSREIDRSLLTINEKLGSGQFGIVYSGILNSADSSLKKYAPRPVAVKSLKMNATREAREDFLDEIKLIIDIGHHPNILAILGCCTVDEPYYLITEYMKYGDLLGFLWKCRDEKFQAEDPIFCITETGQLQIARQIARGMEYLSNTRYYHGDLAARNVLVGEGLVVKISDFGMADDLYQRGYKRLGQEKKRPLKWVSLETNTKGTCSIKSDVWSFGIVLYEIYTLGGVPYPGLDGFEVVRKLEDGYRMEQPDNCPDELYIVMLECWHENPDLRPTFTTLYNKLDRMLSELSSEYFMELDVDDHLSPSTEITNYGYEGTRGDGGQYEALKAFGWSPVPRVTVECVDAVQQENTTDTSKC